MLRWDRPHIKESRTLVTLTCALYSFMASAVVLPCLNDPDLFSFEVVLAGIFVFMSQLILFQRILYRKNFLFLLALILAVSGYSLKFVYLVGLESSHLDSMGGFAVYHALVDTFDVGYLRFNADTYKQYISYYVVYITTIGVLGLLVPPINLSNARNLFKTTKPVFGNNEKYVAAIVLILTVVGVSFLNYYSFGISSGQVNETNRAPFKLDTIALLFYRLVMSFSLLVYNIKTISLRLRSHKKYPYYWRNLFASLTYYVLFAFYTTSKEYLLIFTIIGAYSIYGEFMFSIGRSTIARRSISAFLKGFVLLTILLGLMQVGTVSRFIRNSAYCAECNGFDASIVSLRATLDGEGTDVLTEIGNDIGAQISLFDKFMFSTIFRTQGADNVLQILAADHTDQDFIDVLGPLSSTVGFREAGHQFFFYRILPFDRIGVDLGVAFPPSLIGLSLQVSKNPVNPAIFASFFILLYYTVIYKLFESRFLLINVLGLAWVVEFMRMSSEGTTSLSLLSIGLGAILIDYLLRYSAER